MLERASTAIVGKDARGFLSIGRWLEELLHLSQPVTFGLVGEPGANRLAWQCAIDEQDVGSKPGNPLAIVGEPRDLHLCLHAHHRVFQSGDSIGSKVDPTSCKVPLHLSSGDKLHAFKSIE